MKLWWVWALLLVAMTLTMRQLASYQDAADLQAMQVAPIGLSHTLPPELLESDRDHASWLGKTGLSANTELELIAYLRMKLGEASDDPSAIQPEDMLYLGAFEQDDGQVYYWLLPHQGMGDHYATASVPSSGRVIFGLASTPPQTLESGNQPPMEPDLNPAEEESLFALP